MISAKDIYWLAGIIEGKGYFGIGRTRYPYIQVRTTDLDIIERVNVFFKASICKEDRSIRKTSYVVRSSHKTSVPLIMTIYTLLGQRRRTRAKYVLALWRNWKSNLRPGTNAY